MDKYSLEMLNKFRPHSSQGSPKGLSGKKLASPLGWEVLDLYAFAPKFRFLPHGPAEEPAWEVVMLTSILREIALEGGGGQEVERDMVLLRQKSLGELPPCLTPYFGS